MRHDERTKGTEWIMVNVSRAGNCLPDPFIASIILSGEVIGSFADPDSQFVALFSDAGNRVADVAGSFPLVFVGLSFAWFAYLLAREARGYRAPLLITGAAAAGDMIIAALAFATVPLSMAFGAFIGDPGSESGHAALPQSGRVAFGLGDMLPAGVFIAIAARTPEASPLARPSQLPDRCLGGPDSNSVHGPSSFIVWVIAVTAIQRQAR